MGTNDKPNNVITFPAGRQQEEGTDAVDPTIRRYFNEQEERNKRTAAKMAAERDASNRELINRWRLRNGRKKPDPSGPGGSDPQGSA